MSSPNGPVAEDVRTQLDRLADDLRKGAEAALPGLKKVVQQCMDMEQRSVESSVEILTKAVDICADPSAKSLVLNNLGCIEKRRKNLTTALQHLEKAADVEGGLAAASPITLLNLSATYSALQMYAEAAAVANHAVLRVLTDVAVSSAAVRAAAYHNLATALEGSGELVAAADAYRCALKATTNKDSPAFRTIKKAADQLELQLRNVRAHQEQSRWAEQVGPTVVRQSLRALRKHGALPPLEHVAPRAITRCDGNTTSVYERPLKKFHAIRSLRPPPTIKDLQQQYSPTRRCVSCEPPPLLIEWSFDPHLQSNVAHRTTPLPRDVEIDRHIEERYIPRKLMPLVEDLRYKEATRRRAIIHQCQAGLAHLRQQTDKARLIATEDEERGNLEIYEVRVRRVLLQYIEGRVVFTEGSVETCRAEEAARDAIVREMLGAFVSWQPRRESLALNSQEEQQRFLLIEGERERFNEIRVQHETDLAESTSRLALRASKRPLAYALTMWCLEGVLDAASVAQLEDPSMRTSLHYIERYVEFGPPVGPAAPVRPPPARSPTTVSSPVQ